MSNQPADRKPVCAVVGIGPKNGASFAREFHRRGYELALLSRSTEFSSSLVAELGAGLALECDVTDAAAVAGAFASVSEKLGDVAVVIYNAGSGSWGNIEEITAEQFETSWRVNALGAFLVAKQAALPMKERGAGSFVIVGATASLRGKPFTTAFAPAKAAQRSLAQAMARHLGPHGVHVALLIIDGQIAGPDENLEGRAPTKLDPDAIAQAAASLVEQPRSAWTFELDLRPSQENW